MASFQRDFAITCTLFLCIQLAQAVINLHNSGNPTYVSKGSELNIPWTFTDKVSDISLRKWSFNNGSAPDFKTLGSISGDGNYDVNPSSLFTTEVKKPATLSIKNVNLHHNGTYRFQVNLRFGTDPDPSDVVVIITEQPNAVPSCNQTSTVNEGENFTCLCEGKGGNPPPTASWIRNGKTVVSGYLRAMLSLKNVQRTDAGSYTCKVASHDRTNEIVVKLTVNFAPKQDHIKFPVEGNTVAVLNKQFTITCDAEGSPEPTYKLFHNGSELTAGVSGGKYTIKSVSYTDAGEYKCEAENSLGSANKSFTLTVTDTAPTVTSATTSTTSGGTADSDESSGGLGTGAIVGIVVGVLFLILLVLFLVWWCKFRDSDERKNRGDSHQGMNEEPSPGPSRNQDENAYETPGTRAGTSRSSNQPPGAKSDMPPVYSQVDKSKKTKKPPPTAQSPALTYAALDPVALQPDSSKMRERPHEETQYADINLEKLQGDLV